MESPGRVVPMYSFPQCIGSSYCYFLNKWKWMVFDKSRKNWNRENQKFGTEYWIWYIIMLHKWYCCLSMGDRLCILKTDICQQRLHGNNVMSCCKSHIVKLHLALTTLALYDRLISIVSKYFTTSIKEHLSRWKKQSQTRFCSSFFSLL